LPEPDRLLLPPAAAIVLFPVTLTVEPTELVMTAVLEPMIVVEPVVF
jgi:hypothetical protein